jgi:hypothetical protein
MQQWGVYIHKMVLQPCHNQTEKIYSVLNQTLVLAADRMLITWEAIRENV